MNSRIWLSPPHMGGTEIKYVNEAFDTNWIAPLGPNVTNFEKELAAYLGKRHCAALVSGTSAIHLALIIAGVEQGDEVICQSFTFSATANPILYLKAVPVFIDSEPETWNMDPVLLEEAIKDRIRKGKKPKAIMVVHLYGMPAKMDEILRIAAGYEIPVIEDAAEALGSRYRDRFCGSFGIMGILSFNGNKIITTSGGGALISDNQDYIIKARFLSTQARDKAPHYQHSEVGYNYRMSNIVAGVGRGQLEVLDKRIGQRRANNNFYRRILNDYGGITFLTEQEYTRSNYWLTTVLIDPDQTGGISGNDILAEFGRENIECRPLWKPMHLQPIFKDVPSYINGFSEYAFNHGICLPSGSSLTSDEKQRIEEKLHSILNNK